MILPGARSRSPNIACCCIGGGWVVSDCNCYLVYESALMVGSWVGMRRSAGNPRPGNSVVCVLALTSQRRPVRALVTFR